MQVRYPCAPVTPFPASSPYKMLHTAGCVEGRAKTSLLHILWSSVDLPALSNPAWGVRDG